MSIESSWLLSFYDHHQFRQYKSLLPPSPIGEKIHYVYVNHSRQEEQDERKKVEGNIRSSFLGGMIFASTVAVISVAVKVLLVAGLIGLAATPAFWVCAALAILIGALALGIFIHHRYTHRHNETDPTAGEYNYTHTFSVSNRLPKLARRAKVNGVETIRVYQGDCLRHQTTEKRAESRIITPEEREREEVKNRPQRFKPVEKATIENSLPRREVILRNPKPSPEIPGLDVIAQISHCDNPVSPIMDPPDILKKRFESSLKHLQAALDGNNVDEMLNAYQQTYELWIEYTAKKLHKASGNMWTPELYRMLAATHVGEEDSQDILRKPLIDARERIVSFDYKKCRETFATEIMSQKTLHDEIETLFTNHEKLIKKYETTRKLLKMTQYVTEYNRNVITLQTEPAHQVYSKKIKPKVKDLTDKQISDWKDRDIANRSEEREILTILKSKLDGELTKLSQVLEKTKSPMKKEGLPEIIRVLKKAQPFIEHLGKKGLLKMDEINKRKEHLGSIEGIMRGVFYTSFPSSPLEVRHAVKVVIPQHLEQISV